MGFLRRLIAFFVLLCAAALVGTVAYVWAYERPTTLPQNANIVVLSAGLKDGNLGAQSLQRTETGIALFNQLTEAGETPLLVMSGGKGIGDPAAKATLMTDVARRTELPLEQLVTERESHSTLQNALFTRAALGDQADQPIILVTHRYHLPRAWASFWWAGMSDVTLYSAEPVEEPPLIGGLVMESVKWPLNALRAGIFSGLSAAGIDPDKLTVLLR